MNLNCLNTIVQDNLIVNIDLSSDESLLSGNSAISLSKWINAFSSDIILPDYGLTMYDNGATDNMNDGFELTSNDLYFYMNPVGYNTGNTGNTIFSGYEITKITGGTIGNYLDLNGGYLQGFYKLKEYGYEILPPRYNNGVTFETLVNIYDNSSGTIIYVGTRAEDKYNDFYTGECRVETTTTTGTSYGQTVITTETGFTGVKTSEGNYLNAYLEDTRTKDAFNDFESKDETIYVKTDQIENIKNNVISFGLTDNKKLFYKYVDSNGYIKYNTSTDIITITGWTTLSIVFRPYNTIPNYNPEEFYCYDRRLGDLMFYVNGRLFWKESNFEEFYSRCLKNDREKIIGVPFNISWGGGSFGLENSWHYSDFNQDPTTLVQDPNKVDLLIEKNFNDSFIGGIQKLSIYDVALNGREILHNAQIIAGSNNYNINVTKGGRIIYR